MRLFLAACTVFLLLGCIAGDVVEKNGVKKPPGGIEPIIPISPEIRIPRSERLSWFIPDGMRCDPDVFNVFEWAREGRLPNIKRLMERGSYGYSVPTFPSHTPTNFASLLTGTYPKTHGVADGPMHVEGKPLAKPSVPGFRSSSRKVPALWSILEDAGKNVVLVSMPGSTPPELGNGVTVRGRWGGWGADFHSLIFETKSDEQRKKLAKGSRLFFLGYELTKFIEPETGGGVLEGLASLNPPLYFTMDVHGQKIKAKIVDSTDDESVNYDTIGFSKDGEAVLATLGEGEWSGWIPATFTWQEKEVESNLKINVIKLGEDGFFRVRTVVDNLNRYIVDPPEASDHLHERVGPMVDFVDNFPPQLIYYPEDKKTFLDEMRQSFRWHRESVSAVYELYDPDVFIHDIYSPNQMLTGRWWMGYVDPASSRYNEVSEKERGRLWREVMDMYLELDKIVGEMLDNAGEDTLIVLSSDHGATPLDNWIRVNNLFAEKGWLKYSIDDETGEPAIDWENSQAVYLKMDNVYIHPGGLGGDWNRASGPEYERLRMEVADALLELSDSDGVKPVVAAVRWEDVEKFLDLPTDRVGDLVIANRPGYGFNEEVTSDGEIFQVPLKTGYKQAIFANDTKAMWTPFIIAGPGVKKGYEIKQPIEMVDQFPTIMALMNQEIPDYVEGEILKEILT